MTNEELQKIYVKADMKLDALKDNIHHLEEENKQLKEDIETFKLTITTQQQMIVELINKIDKAIDYITTEQLYTNYQWGKSQYAKILKDLLEILGDKKNE